MVYKVTIYCPDHHLLYDGQTPDKRGIGGGVTARIRLARALARLGNDVTMICNTPTRGVFNKVLYLPVDQVKKIDTDVLILSSSGDKLDLRPSMDLEIQARLRIAWVHGTPLIGGIHEIPYDFLYSPSNFIRRIVLDQWKIAPEKLFVSGNGIERAYFKTGILGEKPQRNPYRLIFAGGPSKGLNAAIGVLEILRKQDDRFELHVYGGGKLYGRSDEPDRVEPGLVYHGTISQPALCSELKKGSFALNLQTRPDAFGITVVESMAAGCIVVASQVGAYPEIIQNGCNSFMVSGDHEAPETQFKAAAVILGLTKNPELAKTIRQFALASPFDSDTYTEACIQHWAWRLDHGEVFTSAESCPECGGTVLGLADGYHCSGCGRYSRDLPVKESQL